MGSQVSKPNRRQESRPPIPVAILLCDQVITEKETGKKSIIGVFDRIWARTFPVTHKSAAIYIRIADAEGSYDMRIQYVKVDTQEVLDEATGRLEVQLSERYGEADFAVPLSAIMIPEPGYYEFRLFLNGQFFQKVRFQAVQITT
jgi:hypothetical protein